MIRLADQARGSLLDLASSGVYQATEVTFDPGRLLPYRFTLTRTFCKAAGGLLSVALSLASRLVGVTDRSAL